MQQATAFTQLNKAVSNIGASHEVAGKSLDSIIEKQSGLTGFSTTDLAAGLTSLETDTKNTAKAFKLLTDAEDLARGTGESLSDAASQVGRAYQGSATALAREQIIVKPVTTAVRELAAAHAAGADKGYVYSASQEAAYQVALKNATIQDKILTGQEAINELIARFGGEATKFATTPQGEFDKLKTNIDSLEVSIGNKLLPVVEQGIGTLDRWSVELSKSKSASDDAKAAAGALATGFHDVEDVARTVGPVLLQIGKGAEEVVKAVGSPALLAAAGAYVAIRVAVAGVDIAQSAYNTVLKASIDETVEQTGANAALAESYTGVGLASTATAETSFARGLGALATGPAGLAIGLTAVAGGIAYLLSKEETWSGVNNAVTSSVQNLDQALQQQARSSGAAAQASGAAVQSETALLVANLDKQASFVERVGDTFGHAAQNEQVWIDALEKNRQAVEKVNPDLAHSFLLLEQLSNILGKPPPPYDITLLINNKDPNASLTQVLSGLGEIGNELDAISATAFQAITSNSQANLPHGASDVAGGFETAAEYAKQSVTSGAAHTTLTEAGRLAVEQLAQGVENAQQEQQDLNQQMQDAVQQGAIAVYQAIQQAQQNFITIGQSIATDIGTYIDTPLTLTGNALQLQADRIANIQQNLVTRFAGQNAVLDQETNRISQRAALLTFTEEKASFRIGGKPLSANNTTALAQLERYKDTLPAAGQTVFQHYIDQFQTDLIAVQKANQQIVIGAQNVKTAQEAADIAGKQAHLRVLNDIATNEKTAATNSINDWAAEWEEKKITLQRFDRDVSSLIKRDTGGLKNVGKIPGGALIEAQLRGDITGIAQQALAIQQGPQSLGAGFIPEITHPLTALQNEQKQISQLAHSDATTQTTIQQDMRSYLSKIWGAQKNAGALSSLPRLTPAQVAAQYARTHIPGSVSG